MRLQDLVDQAEQNGTPRDRFDGVLKSVGAYGKMNRTRGEAELRARSGSLRVLVPAGTGAREALAIIRAGRSTHPVVLVNWNQPPSEWSVTSVELDVSEGFVVGGHEMDNSRAAARALVERLRAMLA